MKEPESKVTNFVEYINSSSEEIADLRDEIGKNISEAIEHAETLKLNIYSELCFLLDSFNVVGTLPFFASYIQFIKLGIKYFNFPETEQIDEITDIVTMVNSTYLKDVQEWITIILKKNTDYKISEIMKKINTFLDSFDEMFQNLIQP